MGIVLNDKGQQIVRRGGADDQSDDDLLLLELIARAPNMSQEAYEQCFVSLRMEYGNDALRAIRSGEVKFELIAPRDAKDYLPPKVE